MSFRVARHMYHFEMQLTPPMQVISHNCLCVTQSCLCNLTSSPLAELSQHLIWKDIVCPVTSLVLHSSLCSHWLRSHWILHTAVNSYKQHYDRVTATRSQSWSHLVLAADLCPYVFGSSWKESRPPVPQAWKQKLKLLLLWMAIINLYIYICL